MSKYLEKVLSNCQAAKDSWEKFAKECDHSEEFKRQFHLRPTSSNVTIVSTLKEKPMRGKTVPKTKLSDYLTEIDKIINVDASSDEKMEKLTELGFKDRKSTPTVKKEESYQAEMISGMSKNEKLKSLLKVEELSFVASEFILNSAEEENGDRIDIIAYDGKSRLIFFELKEPDNKKDDPVAQIKRYLSVYGETQKRADMLAVLSAYPMNAIDNKHVTLEGYAVYGYSDDEISRVMDEKGRLQGILFVN